mmetsp:Transcript_10404/g.11633  ORF Transcript_10404/g.11633 Transcript_10404/m.11633 type:complete len:332 (-) Transcript_10404:284-1279(-)
MPVSPPSRHQSVAILAQGCPSPKNPFWNHSCTAVCVHPRPSQLAMSPPSDMTSDCHYKVLGLDSSASDADVTRAYKRLSLKHHPDKNRDDQRGAEEKFKRITEAYKVLHNAGKRKAYDLSSEGHKFGTGSGGGLSSAWAEYFCQTVFNDDSISHLYKSMGRMGSSSMQSECYAAPAGTQVVVHSLAKVPEHNGKTGMVVSWDDPRGRYKVQLDDGISMMLRPQNLTQLTHMEVVGQSAKPELNNCSGRVIAFDEERGCYHVMLDSPRLVLGLQPANCILPEGTHVVLSGLAKAELNGTMAQILSTDHAAARYTVRCRGGRCLKVKYENVRC